MAAAQYIFCVIYLVFSIALIGIIALQKGQERGGLGALSGGTVETYYSRNRSRSPEGMMKRWTKVIAVCWVLMNGIGLFVLG